MSEMVVERVAKAIYESRNPPDWDVLEEWYKEDFRIQARAAIEATGIEQLRAELEEWEHCARYDPMMSGDGRFKGWDRSQMERCRRKYEDKVFASRRAASDAER